MRKHTSETGRLPFFGIGKVLPYLKNYKTALIGLVGGCLVGSLVDIGVPLFQRYALNHYIGESTLDTLAVFILNAAVYYFILHYQKTDNGKTFIYQHKSAGC